MSTKTKLDGMAFCELRQKHSIRSMAMVPSLLREYLLQPQSLCDLDCIVLWGEKLPADLIERCWQQYPSLRVEDYWGCTEVGAFGFKRAFTIETGTAALGSYNTADQDTRALVTRIDDPTLLVAPGELGELCVVRSWVASQYVGMPAMTATKFLPAADGRSGIMFRTGDAARWWKHGELFLEGRLDHQVKVRGQMVNLVHIEAEARMIPEITNVAATSFTVREQLELALFYVQAEGTGAQHSLSPADVRAALALSLPTYAVPRFVTAIEALPLTISGKIDRKKLPEPTPMDWITGGGAAFEFVAPVTAVEVWLAGHFARLLGLTADKMSEGSELTECTAAIARVAGS